MLLLINAFGLLRPLRSPDVDGYVDFAGGRNSTYGEAIRRLEELDGSARDARGFLTEATRVVHRGMAHVDPADVRRHGLAHYRMRVPLSENWLLFALSYLKPDTYENYEFCDYRKALERGTGRCGQQALALVGFLSECGFETGFVRLGGHVIAMAKAGERGWYLLDPDYGGVVPYGLAEAESDPAGVLRHYWTSVAEQRRVDELFEPEGNSVLYGGPEARWGRAYPIERVAYASKWAVPLVLIACALLPAALHRRGEPHA